MMIPSAAFLLGAELRYLRICQGLFDIDFPRQERRALYIPRVKRWERLGVVDSSLNVPASC